MIHTHIFIARAVSDISDRVIILGFGCLQLKVLCMSLFLVRWFFFIFLSLYCTYIVTREFVVCMMLLFFQCCECLMLFHFVVLYIDFTSFMFSI